MNLILGDCLAELAGIPNDWVHSVVTDPPYGLAFMGKRWDYNVPSVDVWREVLRVLRPGGHLLSFGGTRTYHRMVVAIEDAGFEIRDQIQWIYGSGFPKSLNIGNGQGTALKPANEPIVLARKPLSEKTVAANVMKWGTGGINVDGSRVEASDQTKFAKNWDREKITDIRGNRYNAASGHVVNKIDAPQGRFPANVIFDEEAGEMLDGQTGNLKNGGQNYKTSGKSIFGTEKELSITKFAGDSGGASRFFYCAKASKRERNAGLEGMPEKKRPGLFDDDNYQWDPRKGHKIAKPSSNHHPTVKPIALMEYLCRLITPPNGTILDPFMGSGTTGLAAKNLGFHFVGIEREKEYFDIATRRIEAR